jgi:TatD DNase family protein
MLHMILPADSVHDLMDIAILDLSPQLSCAIFFLDHNNSSTTILTQVEVFQRQLELAKELEKPVSVHCVRAFGDLLEILK